MKAPEGANARAIRAIGGAVILVSFLLLPFIFERHFAMAVLLPSTRYALWCFFAAVFTLSALIVLKPHKIPQLFPLLLLSVILLVAVEFSFRLYINIAEPHVREEIAHYATGTYSENQAYIGHPFLQFTGRPHATLKGNKALGNLPHMLQFNNILRRIAEAYGDQIIFVDLDREMTGKMEAIFYDLGHMEQEGIDFKAKKIGAAVLADFNFQKRGRIQFMLIL